MSPVELHGGSTPEPGNIVGTLYAVVPADHLSILDTDPNDTLYGAWHVTTFIRTTTIYQQLKRLPRFSVSVVMPIHRHRDQMIWKTRPPIVSLPRKPTSTALPS